VHLYKSFKNTSFTIQGTKTFLRTEITYIGICSNSSALKLKSIDGRHHKVDPRLDQTCMQCCLPFVSGYFQGALKKKLMSGIPPHPLS
jgi:hypothetical protein